MIVEICCVTGGVELVVEVSIEEISFWGTEEDFSRVKIEEEGSEAKGSFSDSLGAWVVVLLLAGTLLDEVLERADFWVRGGCLLLIRGSSKKWKSLM